MSIYVSSKSCGINSKQFFRDLGTTMMDVSRKTGVSRAALSRIPACNAYAYTANTVLEFLENDIKEQYVEEIQELQKNWIDIPKKIDEAWERYIAQNDIIQKYKKEYGIEGKQPLIEKIELEQEQEISNDVNAK